jgi:hypothetical protein
VFHVDSKRNDEGLGAVVADAPLTPVFDAVVAVMPTGRHEKTPDRLKPVGGSNVTQLAEVARFELARGLNLNPLSRRAH